MNIASSQTLFDSQPSPLTQPPEKRKGTEREDDVPDDQMQTGADKYIFLKLTFQQVCRAGIVNFKWFAFKVKTKENVMHFCHLIQTTIKKNVLFMEMVL